MADISTNPILARSGASQNPPRDLPEEPVAESKKSATPPIDPKLQAIEDALAKNNQRLQASTSQLESGALQTQQATSIIKESMGEITRSTQIVAAATQNADLTAQNNANAVLQAAGGTEEQVKLMSRLKSEGDRVSDLLAQKADILDDEHTGLFIIDSIVNGFRAAPVQRDLRIAAQQQNQTIGQIQNMTAAQEGFARVNFINKKSITDATIAANARKIEAEGRAQAAELDIRNVQTNAEAMNRLITADARLTSNLLESYRLEGEAGNRAFREEQLAFERENMAQRREQWEFAKPKAEADLEMTMIQLRDARALEPSKRVALEAQAKKQAKDIEDGLAFEQQLVSGVQRAQSMAGLPIEPAETIMFKTNNPSTRDKYIKLQELGATSKLQLGGTPFDAASTLKQIDSDGAAIETKGTTLLDTIAREQLEAYAEAGVAAPKGIDQFKADFNLTAKTKMKAAAKNIVPGDSTNPYQAPPMSVLENFAEVKNTKLWREVLAPLGMTETNPQRITESAAAAVSAKIVTPEEAAKGVVALFTAAALHNNTLEGGFERIGMAEYNQTSYNTVISHRQTYFETLKKGLELTKQVSIAPQAAVGALAFAAIPDEPFAVSRSEVVNLMNPAQVQQLIVKQLSGLKPTSATKEGN